MSVNLRELKQVGTYPSVEEKVTLQLAWEYQEVETPNRIATSWENQEKAMEYFNAHGFEDTLAHMLSLREKNEAGG